MNYQQIKQNLNRAEALVNAGSVAEAHQLIKSMVGQGLTGHDLKTNLSTIAYAKLAKHERETVHGKGR